MAVNKATLDLIKEFEGWEAAAYRDPIGIWTIGYGHTAMAGPPVPKAGMKISRAEGEKILRRDMQQYEKAVDDAVKLTLNANQRGALVSFCYNVGPANFRKSSVLKRVNANRLNEVPGRLMLWNKAGGRVLRGLTRRRAAEGALFMRPVNTQDSTEAIEETVGVEVEQDTGKPAGQSTTIWSTIGAFATTLIAALQGLETYVAIAVIVVAAGFAAWIIRERMKKKTEHGI